MKLSTDSFFFKDLKIFYTLGAKMKNSYISIDKEQNIFVKTPSGSIDFVKDLLSKRESWIRKKLAYMQQYPPIYIDFSGIDDKKRLEKLQRRVEYFSGVMGLKYSCVKFRKMKRRWGSCNSRGEITLNKRLLNTPQVCIDYVVVHELAHIKYQNHSKKFHDFTKIYHKDTKKAQNILSRIVI